MVFSLNTWHTSSLIRTDCEYYEKSWAENVVYFERTKYFSEQNDISEACLRMIKALRVKMLYKNLCPIK